MATPKDTLTAYTQALNTIATQTFKPGQLMAFTFRADEPTCTVGIRGGFDPGIINGHVYGITVYGMPNTVYASLKHVKATAEGDVLTFERLSPDAHGIVKAVLAELDARETKPDKSYTLAQLDAMRSSMYTPKDFKVKDYFGGADISPEREALARINQIAAEYAANAYWREGEGNNP